MTCAHFGICGGCSLNTHYQEQLDFKIEHFVRAFGFSPDFIFASPDRHFRARAEFRIHTQNHHDKKLKPDSPIFLSMNALGKNSRIPITSCQNLLEILDSLVKKLPVQIAQNPILREKLYAVNLLGNSQNSCIITLIYHKKLDEKWKEGAGDLLGLLDLDEHSGIVGICKNEKHIIKHDRLQITITLKYPLQAPKNLLFMHSAGTFSQPNHFINQKMLQFVIDQISAHKRLDLLELYCGSGNFTLALAPIFRQVFATEVVKSAICNLRQNVKNNLITNITSARLSGHESILALKRHRDFFRLKDIDLDSFDFSHILVDPPRSGIADADMLDFMGEFPHIIYISCNPESLKKDLEFLARSHQIQTSAIFDQFPYTRHIESIIVLSKR